MASPVLDGEFDSKTHTFSRNGRIYHSITTVLSMAGVCDYSFVEEDRRNTAMERGKSVHWLTQLEDEGGLNYRTVPHALHGFRKAYRRWKENTGFIPMFIEERFICEEFGYAGIVDRMGYFSRRFDNVILDLKTGVIQNWVAMQLAAGAVGLTGSLARARITRRIALRLKADGTCSVKEFPPFSFDRDFSQFMDYVKKVSY